MKINKEKRDEFKRHKAEIEEWYKRKLEALYILYPEFAPSWEKSDNENGGSTPRGKLPRLVRDFVSKHAQSFTLHEVGKWISEIDPDFSKTVTAIQISNTLGRFVRKEKLEKVPNTSPTQYIKKKTTTNV